MWPKSTQTTVNIFKSRGRTLSYHESNNENWVDDVISSDLFLTNTMYSHIQFLHRLFVGKKIASFLFLILNREVVAIWQKNRFQKKVQQQRRRSFFFFKGKVWVKNAAFLSFLKNRRKKKKLLLLRVVVVVAATWKSSSVVVNFGQKRCENMAATISATVRMHLQWLCQVWPFKTVTHPVNRTKYTNQVL